MKLLENAECCGCMACYNICPNNCINMKEDILGFKYPVIAKEKCVGCNMCKKVCPMEKKEFRNSDTACYAAYNKDKEIVESSSSGGIFWIFAKYVVEELGGIVYGAKQKENFYICHERADNIKDCEGFRGSKYLQSDIGYCYQKVKKDLLQGKWVLFSGTPCQIAGLYSFLGEMKEQEKLYTVEVICHGVPSRTVFYKYIDYVKEKTGKIPARMNWRNKKYGWGPNHVSITYEDGSESITTSYKNSFQFGFLKNVYLRSSCYCCHFARLPRGADISLADFWGYDGSLQTKNDNRGLSLMVISNEKGRNLFQSISDKLLYDLVETEYAKSKSRHLWLHPEYNPDRKNLVKRINKITFEEIDRKYIHKNVVRKVFSKIRNGIRNGNTRYETKS